MPGHEPNAPAVLAPFDDREAEDLSVEALGGLHVQDLEDELADPGNPNPCGHPGTS